MLVLRNVSTSDSGIYVCFATLPVPTATTRTGTATIAATTTTAATTAAAATTSTLTEEEKQQQRKQEQAQRKVEETQGEGDKMPEEQKPVEEEEEEQKYQAFQRIKLTVRTTPGPVTQLYFKASTILGFLIWRFNKTQSGGYPVRSFTAEYRNISYRSPPANASYEHEWVRMDPINIAPNVVSGGSSSLILRAKYFYNNHFRFIITSGQRQMEVYRLAPNTTYEFRIWANNELGSGDVVTTNVTTLPETKEEGKQ